MNELMKIVNELMKVQTYSQLKSHYMILWFYMFLVFITATIGHVIDKKEGFTYGMIIGFLLSLSLWYQYGRKMVY